MIQSISSCFQHSKAFSTPTPSARTRSPIILTYPLLIHPHLHFREGTDAVGGEQVLDTLANLCVEPACLGDMTDKAPAPNPHCT